MCFRSLIDRLLYSVTLYDKFCHKVHETVAVNLLNIMTQMKKSIHIKVYLGFYIVSYFHNPTKKQHYLKD